MELPLAVLRLQRLPVPRSLPPLLLLLLLHLLKVRLVHQHCVALRVPISLDCLIVRSLDRLNVSSLDCLIV